MALAVGIVLVFSSPRAEAWRFVFPGFAAILIFVLFPVIYTIWLGFTNYSSFNLLTYDRAVQVLMANKSINPETERKFAVTGAPGAYRIWLPDDGLLSSEVKLDGTDGPATLDTGTEPADLSPTKAEIKPRDALQMLELQRASDGVILKNSGLRTFAEVTSEYAPLDADRYRRVSDGAILTADHSKGIFVTEAGEEVPPAGGSI